MAKLHQSSKTGSRPQPPPPVPNYLSSNCIRMDEKRKIEGAGSTLIIFMAFFGLACVMYYLIIIHDFRKNKGEWSLKLRGAFFCTLVLIGLACTYVFYFDGVIKPKNKLEWPTTKEEQPLCSQFLQHVYGEHQSTIHSVERVQELILPVNKVVRNVQFEQYSHRVIVMRVRRTDADGTVKTLDFDLELGDVVKGKQLVVDAVYSTDLYQISFVARNGVSKITYMTVDLPEDYIDYIKMRGIVARECSHELLHVDSDLTAVKKTEIFC